MSARIGNIRRKVRLSAVYPKIPKSVTTPIGFTVDLTSRQQWRTYVNPEKRGTVTFPLALLLRPQVLDLSRDSDGRILRRRSLLGDTLLHVVLLYCTEIIRTRMPGGARNVMIGFIHFEKYLAQIYRWGSGNYNFYASHINREILDSYSRWIADNCPDNDKYIGYVRSLYEFGVRMRFPGFDAKKLRQLQSVKSRSKFAGEVARFRDPVKGAFDFEEQRQILAAFDEQKGRPEDRAIAGIFHQTGIRNAAAIRLRKKHLRLAPGADKYFLDVPRSKQRYATDATRTHIIEKWLGDLIVSLQPKDHAPNAFLIHWVRDFRAAKDIRRGLSRWAEDCGLVSLRLDDEMPMPLPMSPYRFRRTLASNLAAQGASPWTIAEILDDKTIGMAVIYTNNSSTIVEVLAETLDRHPAWYRVIRLFLGQLEKTSDHALPMIIGGVPYLAEYGVFLKKIGEIGRCAFRNPCELSPPLSCYRCSHFRALLDAKTHEAQLEQLKHEINRSVGVESDRVTAVLLDDIAAILSVIAAINDALGRSSRKTKLDVHVSKAIATTRAGGKK